MPNDFYNDSGVPSTGSAGSSATMRAEFAAIEEGFNKLPTLTGNGGEIVRVNAGASALETVAGTGTGAPVLADGPTLTTPNIGAATATSINGVAITGTGTIASGAGIGAAAYTPTLANVSNTNSRTLNGAWYIRVAGFAVVFIQFSAVATAGGQATIDATLPFTPDVTGTVDVIGAGTSLGGGFTSVAVAAISASKAQITWDASGDPTADNLYVVFSFPIS